jgi:hypothetical protein
MKKHFLKISKMSMVLVQLALVTNLYACNVTATESNALVQPDPIASSSTKNKIQVALLLDTSNSMDGLIEQAKARLWNIINTLTTLKYKGVQPNLEIALYEYGNDNLSASEGHIRQVLPFTSDLDLLSEKLFSLKTNGGLEYCGYVIKNAIHQLTWDQHHHSMKLVYIAGNESFAQGKENYKEAIATAVGKGIYVNTIYCGDYQSGIREEWQAGANKGQGKYFNIDQNRSIRYVETPYDSQLEVLNEKLNHTYHSYGSRGEEFKTKQRTQDANAGSMSKAVQAERTVSKSQSNYKNHTWDMVDAYNADKEFVNKVKKEDLPPAYQAMSQEEITHQIAQLDKQRKAISKEIAAVSKKRTTYLEQQPKTTESADDLGKAITQSILEIAKKQQYTPEG